MSVIWEVSQSSIFCTDEQAPREEIFVSIFPDSKRDFQISKAAPGAPSLLFVPQLHLPLEESKCAMQTLGASSSKQWKIIPAFPVWWKRNLVAERGVNAFQKVKQGSCGKAGKTDLAWVYGVLWFPQSLFSALFPGTSAV